MNKKVNITLKIIMIFIFLSIIIPVSFANSTDTSYSDDTLQSQITDENVPDLPTLRSSPEYKDIYFNASLSHDNGNGSISNPYKKLTTNRIESNSNIHLSDGNYTLSSRKTINNVTFIGQSRQNTILSNILLTNKELMTTINLTLNNCSITNNNNITMINTSFVNSTASTISSSSGNINMDNCVFINTATKDSFSIRIQNTNLTINDSLLENNTAYNGGCIYSLNSTITITDSLLLNNSASRFGGAITSLNTNLSIKNTTLKNNNAGYDGGAIYGFYGSLSMVNSTIENNSALEGGALVIDNMTITDISQNIFQDNTANRYTDIYSITSNITNSILDSNTFRNLSANPEDNVYIINVPNMVIGNENYTLFKLESVYENISDLPSSYDLRELNLVTPVKNQGGDGNCWAFAILATLESNILKASNVTYDFSEENMKNIMALYSDYGWNIPTNTGGSDTMPLGYLTSWLGPVNDVDDKYMSGLVLSPVLNSIMHVQNILFLDRKSYTDNDNIKKALMTYGSVAVRIGWYNTFEKGSSYYCYSSKDQNHLVSIIGWDDNYSRDNFRYAPPGDGAWIIKNSWGTDYGENGYFYVSYYDTTCAINSFEYIFLLNDSIRYDKNYQYDIPGTTDYFLSRNESAWYKNIFTATDEEYLEAVSTYFRNNTSYEISIYVNNKLEAIQEGITNAGYYTIDLNRKILLQPDDIFEVVFKITQINESAVPISENISLNKLLYTENISFVSYDGVNWTDFYNLRCDYENSHSYYSQVACIKAFTTKKIAKVKLEIENDNPCNIVAKIVDQHDNPINTGNVTFNIGDDIVRVDVCDSQAQLTRILPIGDITITATFYSDEYGIVTNSTEITVTNPETAKLYVEATVTDKLNLTATLYGSSGRVSNGKIAFKVNGKTLKDANGKVIYVKVVDGTASILYDIDSTWLENIISVTAVYSGSSVNPSVRNNTTIYIPKKDSNIKLTPFEESVKIGNNVTFKATVTDGYAPMTTGKVIFKINGKTIKDENGKVIYAILDSNGEVSVNYTITGLKAKSYTITAVFISDEYKRAEDTAKLTLVN